MPLGGLGDIPHDSIVARIGNDGPPTVISCKDFCQKMIDAGHFGSMPGIVPKGLICMWSGLLSQIPSGWKLCDGSNGTPDLRDKFVKGAANLADPGTTGGSATHTHSNHATLTHSGGSIANASTGVSVNSHTTIGNISLLGLGSALNGPTTHTVTDPQHTHTFTQPNNHTIDAHSTVSNEPVFYAVAFIMKT